MRESHTGRPADRHRVGEEGEVPKVVDVGPRHDRAHEVAAARSLDLQARQLRRDVGDLDLEALRRVGEVVGALVPVRADPQVLGGVAEHGAVVDHEPVLVDERAVANLAVPHADDVVRVHALGGLEGLGPAELPLVQGREVPHAHPLAHRPVLGVDVAVVRDPEPPGFLHEAGRLGRRDRVERGLPALTQPRLPTTPRTSAPIARRPWVGFYQTVERLFKSRRSGTGRRAGAGARSDRGARAASRPARGTAAR